MPKNTLPEWERVLSSAAHLQRILTGAVLVGGTASAFHLGTNAVIAALESFDHLCPQPNGESPLQQLQIQLANPLPYDLEQVDLSE